MVKTKPQKQAGVPKPEMNFDDIMRRVSQLKPASKPAKRKK
jgi:hypothetical protein